MLQDTQDLHAHDLQKFSCGSTRRSKEWPVRGLVKALARDDAKRSAMKGKIVGDEMDASPFLLGVAMRHTG